MDWLVSCVLALATLVIPTIGSFVLWPLVKFAAWYSIYALGALFLRVLYRARYEVFNEDLKYKRAECQKRVVLVTGATSGIGLAAAHHLHARGFVVIACYYSRDEPGYNELNALITGPLNGANQRSMHLVKLDVRSGESIGECYKQVKTILDENPALQLHALLNVAGVGYFHKFQWAPRELIRSMVETNLLGPMLMTRQFVHLLAKCPGSRVVNVASPMGLIPLKYGTVYGATKAGLTHFTNCLGVDLLRLGIKTSTLHPGNLMRNTAVLNASLKARLDNIMPELNEDERQLYKKDLDNHLVRMDLLEWAIKRKRNLTLSRTSSLKSNLIKLSLLISGCIQEDRLDQSSSFMQTFDNSIRLVDPPKEMYAGNSFFNLIIGSTLEWLCRACCRDMFLVAQSSRLGDKF